MYSNIPSANELAHPPELTVREDLAQVSLIDIRVEERLEGLTSLNALFEYVDADDLLLTMPEKLKDELFAFIKSDEGLLEVLADECRD